MNLVQYNHVILMKKRIDSHLSNKQAISQEEKSCFKGFRLLKASLESNLCPERVEHLKEEMSLSDRKKLPPLQHALREPLLLSFLAECTRSCYIQLASSIEVAKTRRRVKVKVCFETATETSADFLTTCIDRRGVKQ